MNHLRRPLVAALAPFLAGLSLALRFDVPTQLAIGIALLGLGLLGCVNAGFLYMRMDDRLGLLTLFLGGGLFLGALARQEAASDCRATLQDGEHLEIRGRLGAAHRSGHGARPPLLPLLDASVAGLTGCTGEFRVRLPQDLPSHPPGADLQLRGEWRSFANPVTPSPWPREPLYRGFLQVDTVEISAGRAVVRSPLMAVRSRADRSFARLFPRHHALVEALLLGRREYVDPAITEKFATSGLTHLLAISGSHVALFAGALLLLGAAFRLPRRLGISAALAATWVYLLVIGLPASGLRAGCMITAALAAALLQRPSAAAPIMALAAFVILGLRPRALLDPGFQLSFLGVIGILALRRPLLAATPGVCQRKGSARAIADALVIGVAAFITTAPVVAHHFGIVAPISILAGVPAIPLTSLALIGTASALALEPFTFPIATLVADGSGLALDLLGWIARVSAAIPYGHMAVPPPPWWAWIAASVSGIAMTRVFTFSGGRVRAVTGWGAGISLLVVWPIGVQGASGGIEVHFLDVGQGDAMAIRTPHNRWILVDAGPASDGFDAGERRVLPFLREQGADRLEFIVLTHPHLDHIGGAPALLRSIEVQDVFEPGAVTSAHSYLALLDAIEASGTHWRSAHSGRTIDLDGVRIDFLWPDPETVDAVEDPNQISAVMRVSFGDFALLLTGDAGEQVEAELVARHGAALNADILKLGHHGSATSTSPPFLDAVNPDLAVISVGRRNDYGHPARRVLNAATERGIEVARTDLEGTISLKVSRDGERWEREEW